MQKKSTDTFGDRIKAFEHVSAKETLDETLPLCVRIDGKAFHQFTKGLARPYDERLSQSMIETMNFLVEKTDARLGYTQSDEISLVYFKMADNQQSYFGARVQKLVSVIASMTTAKFNEQMTLNIPEKKGVFAYFDCRVWNVPSLQDAADVFVWRQEDAIKNAVSMAASAYFSHKFLHGKNSTEKKQLLADKGISWDAYPDFFKSGTFAQRLHKEVQLNDEMKGFASNVGVDTTLRSYVGNFHLPRLRLEEDAYGLLFDKVFEEYQMVIDRKAARKVKV